MLERSFQLRARLRENKETARIPLKQSALTQYHERLFKYLLLLSYRIVHDPCILSLAVPQEYCNCKLSKIYDFDIVKNKSEGLLGIFFMFKRL
jgi:hypothetical protein